MKAINTSYNGHYFRSRLEARWAVYFDALSIKWYYEYEGYELENGQRYLPDFYLPEHGIFVEIKPFEQEDPRWTMLAKATGKELIILDGPPAHKAFKLLVPYDGEVDESEGMLICPGDKYFPVFYGEFLGGDDHYIEAARKANSARFEFSGKQ